MPEATEAFIKHPVPTDITSVHSPTNGQKAAEDTYERSTRKLSILNDLYVDLLGTLVPGLFAVILSGCSILLSATASYFLIFGNIETGISVTKVGRVMVSNFHYEIAIITLVSSYVIGSIFFRQDPKRPDASSALYIWMNSTPDDRDGLASQSLGDWEKMHALPFSWKDKFRAFWQPDNFINKYALDTQFPYPHLRCYLGARGLTHLTQHVPWCPHDKDFPSKTRKFRTKMFINILKIRLQSLVPNLCKDIVRNEAHVRLATSVWYTATCLLFVGIFCIGLLALSSGIHIARFGGTGILSMLYIPVGSVLAISFFSLIVKYELRKCIHYMRVREVIYVLETSHLADQMLPDRFKLQEITKKADSNLCFECNRFKRETGSYVKN